MLDPSPQQLPLPGGPRSPARLLDVAKGVLVALRRCDTDQAFSELLDVSRKYAVPTLVLASALVNVAGRAQRGDSDPEAANAVEQEWGSLLLG